MESVALEIVSFRAWVGEEDLGRGSTFVFSPVAISHCITVYNKIFVCLLILVATSNKSNHQGLSLIQRLDVASNVVYFSM